MKLSLDIYNNNNNYKPNISISKQELKCHFILVFLIKLKKLYYSTFIYI